MGSTRRGFMKALGVTTIGGLAGCSQGDYETDEQEADLYDILDGVKYDQKERLEDHNGNFRDPAFDTETLQINTDPEDILESSGNIDYTTTVRTHVEGPFRDMSSFTDDYCCDGSPLANSLATMVAQNIWYPLKNSAGGSAGDVEAGKEFKERMGDISAKVVDHEGNKAEVKMPRSTAEKYWEDLESHYQDDEWEDLEGLSREITDWTKKNMEKNF